MAKDVTSQSFVPGGIDHADFGRLEPLYKALVERAVNSARELEKWLLDFSELTASVSEYGSRCSIEKSCHTDDPEIEKKYLHFVEHISPRVKLYYFELQKKFMASPHRKGLSGPKYFVLGREWKNEVELFREENIPLQTQTAKLCNEFDKACGAMIVEFQGKQHTLQQMARFGEEPDRTVRQSAWETAEQRRGRDRERIESIFDELMGLRARIAANAGCANFRDYMWRAFHRFDYTAGDCERFAGAIEKTCVPVVNELNRKRCADLGLERLRPWDLAVDPKNRAALRPFKEDQIEEFVGKTKEIFNRISPELEKRFGTLKAERNLDLASRKGKRPGGFQASLEVVKEPFIFMNAAGLQRDVETLLHEAGHAFHYIESRREPLVFLRHAPLEFCEVASMSMELLADDHLGVFYADEAEAGRAKATHLEGIIRFFPWMATIDMFQHWLYTNPGHTKKERLEAWLRIHKRFSSELVDWTGLEETRGSLWQRQIHLFHYPFYYVEYGIAQLGALQVWLGYHQNPGRTLSDLLFAFGLGGTRPLPELFEAAGIRFDFSEAVLGPMMEAVGREMKAGEINKGYFV